MRGESIDLLNRATGEHVVRRDADANHDWRHNARDATHLGCGWEVAAIRDAKPDARKPAAEVGHRDFADVDLRQFVGECLEERRRFLGKHLGLRGRWGFTQERHKPADFNGAKLRMLISCPLNEARTFIEAIAEVDPCLLLIVASRDGCGCWRALGNCRYVRAGPAICSNRRDAAMIRKPKDE